MLKEGTGTSGTIGTEDGGVEKEEELPVWVGGLGKDKLPGAEDWDKFEVGYK